MNKSIFLFLSLYVCSLFSQGSVIVLYGGSSAGKTSTSLALRKIMPGKWKFLSIDMFSNKDGSANSQLWHQVSKDIKDGYDLIVDTIFDKFLLQSSSGAKLFVVLMYCSPIVIVDHVEKRNKTGDDREHRTLSKVLSMFCHKFRPVATKDNSIDVLRMSDVEKHISNRRALKKIKEEFFRTNQPLVYIASRLPKSKYDCFINTGTMSISECAQQIKKEFQDAQG